MPTLNKVLYKGGTYSSLLDMIYPVGSIFLTISSTNPASLFGGTWVKIENALLAASGSSYGNAANSAGSNTIAIAQVPSHTHTGPSHTHGVGTLATSTTGAHIHSWKGYEYFKKNGTSTNFDYYLPVYGTSTLSSSTVNGRGIQSSGAHSHTISGATAASGTGNTGATGSGNAFIPYHYNVNVWKRTA